MFRLKMHPLAQKLSVRDCRNWRRIFKEDINKSLRSGRLDEFAVLASKDPRQYNFLEVTLMSPHTGTMGEIDVVLHEGELVTNYSLNSR